MSMWEPAAGGSSTCLCFPFIPPHIGQRGFSQSGHRSASAVWLAWSNVGIRPESLQVGHFDILVPFILGV